MQFDADEVVAENKWLFVMLFGLTDPDKKVTIDAGRNGSVIYGGNFSGSLLPFSLISSTSIMNIRIPPLDGIRSHSFTFNITATDQLGLLHQ